MLPSLMHEVNTPYKGPYGEGAWGGTRRPRLGSPRLSIKSPVKTIRSAVNSMLADSLEVWNIERKLSGVEESFKGPIPAEGLN